MNENFYDLYEYDQYNNLVKHVSYYKNAYEEDMYTYNLAYSTVYSPIINLNLPAWFMTDGNIEFGLDYFIGNHTPKFITIEEISTEFAEGKEPVTEKETGTTDLNVKESVDNYPTLLVSEQEWKEKDDNGKEQTYTYSTTTSFEYITIE